MHPVELGQQRNIIDPFGLMVSGSVIPRTYLNFNIRSKNERTMSYQSTIGG